MIKSIIYTIASIAIITIASTTSALNNVTEYTRANSNLIIAPVTPYMPTFPPFEMNSTYKQNKLNIATWNVNMNRFNAPDSIPSRNIYTNKQIINEIPRTHDLLTLHNVWNDGVAIEIIKNMTSDYKYYYRPDARFDYAPLCKSSSETTHALNRLKTCIRNHNINIMSYDDMIYCKDSLQELNNVDHDCLSCVLTRQDVMDFRSTTLYSSEYVIDRICTFTGHHTRTPRYSRSNDPGVLLLSKKCLYNIYGDRLPSNILGRTNQISHRFVKGHVNDGVTTYLNTFIRQGVAIKFKCNGFRLMSLSLPLNLGIKGKSNYTDVFNSLLEKQYDVIYGDFGIGGLNNRCVFDTDNEVCNKLVIDETHNEKAYDNNDRKHDNEDKDIEQINVNYYEQNPFEIFKRNNYTISEKKHRTSVNKIESNITKRYIFSKAGPDSLYKQQNLSQFVLGNSVHYNIAYYIDTNNTVSVHLPLEIMVSMKDTISKSKNRIV